MLVPAVSVVVAGRARAPWVGPPTVPTPLPLPVPPSARPTNEGTPGVEYIVPRNRGSVRSGASRGTRRGEVGAHKREPLPDTVPSPDLVLPKRRDTGLRVLRGWGSSKTLSLPSLPGWGGPWAGSTVSATFRPDRNLRPRYLCHQSVGRSVSRGDAEDDLPLGSETRRGGR